MKTNYLIEETVKTVEKVKKIGIAEVEPVSAASLIMKERLESDGMEVSCLGCSHSDMYLIHNFHLI